MTKLQELMKVHYANRHAYSSSTAYRGINYDIHASKGNCSDKAIKFNYRGQTYTKQVEVCNV